MANVSECLPVTVSSKFSSYIPMNWPTEVDSTCCISIGLEDSLQVLTFAKLEILPISVSTDLFLALA